MLKKLLLAFVAFAFALTAYAQVHNRQVLVEEFTNASCGPCAAQNPNFNALLNNNYDKITAIKYQVWWPGYDPMHEQNPSEVTTRVQYYGVGGVPNGFVDGKGIVNDCNYYDNAPACLTGAEIQSAYNNLTPVTMTMSHSYSANYDSVLVQVSVTSDSVLTGTLRLRIAVTEEEILFNEAPGSNGEKEFYQVMRKMLPNAAGTTTGDFAAGETKTYSFAWKIGYAYDLNQIAACAWLQNDATKEVWQSARSLPIGGIPSAGVAVPSVKTFACAPGTIPVFTLTNIGTAQLTTVTLRWRVGTGAWTDYMWTGDLASGESTQVELPDATITEPGTVNLEVQIVNSNNGIQTNLVSGTSSIQYKSLFDAATATPFEYPFQTTPFPPVGWTVENVGAHGWKLATNAGSNSSRSARCNFYDITVGTAYMTTPKLDLSQADGVSTLSFDHAYAYYNNTFFDSLRVELSNDCGTTWTTIFHDGKDGLSTAPPEAGNAGWIPTADEWTSNSFDISSFNGSPELLVRFVGESGYGNNLYVDNLNISTTVGVKELTLSTFTLQPNPASDFAQIRFGLEKPENIQLSVFNAQGTLVQTRQLGDLPTGEHAATIETNQLPSGVYRVVLQGKEGVANKQMVIVK